MRGRGNAAKHGPRARNKKQREVVAAVSHTCIRPTLCEVIFNNALEAVMVFTHMSVE